jgi:hypothetical protein
MDVKSGLNIERLRRTLIAGSSEQLSVPFSIPADLPAGQYHLISAAGPRGQLVPFASTRRTFTVGSGNRIARPSAKNAAGVFNANLPIWPPPAIGTNDPSILNDNPGLF